MEIKMSVNLECRCCTAAVYRAIGLFLQHDKGGACLMTVDVDWLGEDSNPKTSVMLGWDIRPTAAQRRLFRIIWDAETGMDDLVIGHDSPGTDIDFPIGHVEAVQ